MTRNKHLIFASLVLFMACKEPTRISEINLPNNSEFLFQDPAGDVFHFYISDTFSDNNQERMVYSKYKATRDSTRQIIYQSDELTVFKCDTLSALESLRLERKRILIINGYESINDSGIVNIGLIRDVVFVRYNNTSYLLTFCNRGRYIRLDFVNFGNEGFFKEMLNGLTIQ